MKPRAILFLNPGVPGGRYTTGQQIGIVCNAVMGAGAPFTVPSPVTGGIAPPFDEQINITCAQAISRCLAYHPHAVLWFDYSTQVPSLRFGQRGGLAQRSVALGDIEELDIRQRTDLLVPGVAIYYERTNTVDGVTFPQTIADIYPPSADPNATDTLCAVYDLRGDTVATVSQKITAADFPFPLRDVAWWKGKVPQLNDYASVVISDAKRTGSSLPNILTRGTRQDWMGIRVEPCELTCTATCTMKDESNNTVSVVRKLITVSLFATDASVGTQTLRHITGFQPGEAVPVGVAQAMWQEWSQLHFEGSFVTVRDECGGDILPGNAVGITGGRPEWAGMGAMVVRVSERIDAGETSVAFGPVRGIDLDARVMFERAARTRQFAVSAQLVSGEAEDDGLGGNDMPVQIRDGDADAMTHFKLIGDSADPEKAIYLDPSAIPDSSDLNAKVIAPRQVWLPVITGGKVTGARAAIVMCGELSGSDVELGGAALGTGTPQPDASPGGAGNATSAAPFNHVHPLSAAYASAGHTHAGYATAGQVAEIWGYLNELDAVSMDEFLWESYVLNYKIEEVWAYIGLMESDFARVADVLEIWDEVGDVWDYLGSLDSAKPSNATPQAVADTGAAGNSDEYARGNHVHADKPPANEAIKTTLAGTGATASTASWASGGTAGAVVRVQTRTFYDTSGATPQLFGFYEDWVIDRFGRVYSVSAETRYIIATPALGY